MEKLSIHFWFKRIQGNKMIFNKKELIKRIKILPENDDFFLDKLYFLLGLKKVIRIKTKNKSFKQTIKGLEKINHTSYGRYIFLSDDLKKAELAKKLTILSNMRLPKEKNQKIQTLLGVLYGYPVCCSKNFTKTNTRDPKKEKENILKTRFYYKNKEFNLLYYPCSKNCRQTKILKSLIKQKLDELSLLK